MRPAAVDPTGKSVYAANNEDDGAGPSTIEKTGDLVKITGGDAVRNEPAWSHFSGILLLAFAQLTRKPRLGQVPVALHRGAGNSQYGCSFVNTQAAEKPHLHKLGLLRIEFGEAAESFIQCHDIRGFPLGNSSRFFQKYLLKAVAALLRVMAAAVVDQDTPHQLCGDAQELLPIFPTNFSLIRQAKISLMHQGSSLQGVIAALPPQVVRRQTPQFRVEQHDQLGRGLVIADTEFTQEGGNIWWRIHKDLIRDDRNRREKNGHRSSRNTASSKQEKAE